MVYTATSAMDRRLGNTLAHTLIVLVLLSIASNVGGLDIAYCSNQNTGSSFAAGKFTLKIRGSANGIE
jgi:hypothetical protein